MATAIVRAEHGNLTTPPAADLDPFEREVLDLFLRKWGTPLSDAERALIERASAEVEHDLAIEKAHADLAALPGLGARMNRYETNSVAALIAAITLAERAGGAA